VTTEDGGRVGEAKVHVRLTGGFLGGDTWYIEPASIREDGRFEVPLRHVDSGDIPLHVEMKSEGYAKVVLDGVQEFQTRNLDVFLRKSPITIVGNVTDERNVPVSAARVSAVDWPYAYAEATTDALGAFRIGCVSPGEEYTIQASKEGYAPLPRVIVAVPADRAEIRADPLVLVDGVAFRGKVVDTEGRPIAEAQIEIGFDWPDDTGRYAETTSRSDGTFEFRHLPIPPEGTIRVFSVARQGFLDEYITEVVLSKEFVATLSRAAVVTIAIEGHLDANAGLQPSISFGTTEKFGREADIGGDRNGFRMGEDATAHWNAIWGSGTGAVDWSAGTVTFRFEVIPDRQYRLEAWDGAGVLLRDEFIWPTAEKETIIQIPR
jgi:hypothetical protein